MTSPLIDLIAYIRDETPVELVYPIDDLFENVVDFDNTTKGRPLST